MKSNRFDYFIFITAGFILSVPFFILPIVNCDIGWHLSNGRYIVENLKIPNRDFISWLGERNWINSEWLVHIIYYFIYKISGYKSLYFFKFFNMVLICFGFYMLYAKRFKLPPFVFLWFIPSLYLSFALSLDLRPDNYTFFLFTILIYILEGCVNKEFSFKNAFYFLLLFAIWVNVHSGYIFGLVAVLIYGFSYFISDNIDYIRKKTDRLDIIRFKKFFYYFTFSLFGVILNPYGYKIITVFLSHYAEMKKIGDYIAEWQAPDIFINASTFYYFIFSFMGIGMYFLKFLKTRYFKLSDIFLMVCFVLSSFIHLRLAGFGSIITHMIIARYFVNEFSNNRYVRYGLVISFFSFYFLFEIYTNIINFYPYISKNIFYRNIFVSEYAVRFIEQNWNEFSNKRMYNGWSSGGDLGWRFYQRKKIFIDGRYIFLDILEEHLNAMKSKDRWKNFYTKYDFDFAIYSIYGNKNTERLRINYNGRLYLIERPFYLESIDFENWDIIFFDSVNMILARKDRFPKNFLDKYAYKCILPYDFDRIYFNIHIVNKNIDCFKQEMTEYIRREIKNPEAFISFFTDELSYINRRRK